MYKTIKTLLLGSVLLLAGLNSSAQLLDLGTHWELFIDHYLIDSMEGTALKLHHPHREGVAIPFNDPWDRDASGYATVIDDGGLHRMYYRGGPADSSAGKSEGLTSYFCYAESKDGITWVKPKLGLVEFEGFKENNILLAPSPREDPWRQSLSPFLDTRSGVPADERYKAIGGQSPQGLCVSVFPDGIHWKKCHEKSVLKNGAFDSENVVFWSETENCYVIYSRVFTGIPEYEKPNQKWATVSIVLSNGSRPVISASSQNK